MKIQEFFRFSGFLPRFSSPVLFFLRRNPPLGKWEEENHRKVRKNFSPGNFLPEKKGRKTILLIRSRAREC